jgi:hypothetical protein
VWVLVGAELVGWYGDLCAKTKDDGFSSLSSFQLATKLNDRRRGANKNGGNVGGGEP